MSKHSILKTFSIIVLVFILTTSGLFVVNAQVREQFDIFYNEYWKTKIEKDNLDEGTYKFYENKIRQNNSIIDATGVLVQEDTYIGESQKDIIIETLNKMKYLNEKHLSEIKEAKDKNELDKLPGIYSEIIKNKSKIDLFCTYQGARFLVNRLSSEGGEIQQTINILEQEGQDRTKINILENYYDDLQFYKKDFENSLVTGVSNDGLILDYDKAGSFTKNVIADVNNIISYLEQIYTE